MSVCWKPEWCECEKCGDINSTAEQLAQLRTTRDADAAERLRAGLAGGESS